MAEEEFQSSEFAELGVETSQSRHKEMREQSYLTFPKNTELDVKECARAGLFYNGKCKFIFEWLIWFQETGELYVFVAITKFEKSRMK